MGSSQTPRRNVTFALSILCENPRRRTGLTTLFRGFVAEARRQFPAIRWIVFAGPDQPWEGDDPGVELVRDFPANDRPLARLWADHFRVGPAARRRGATVLLTVGFAPVRRGGVPLVMQVFTLHHRQRGGGVRSAYRRAAVARGLREAVLVITNSEWTAGHLDGARQVLVSPEGLDHGVFNPIGPRGGPGCPTSYLLWVSNFYPYKRVDLALAAYARLPAAMRAEFPLVLVGGDWSGGRARAEAQAAQLGISADTRFLGWVDDAALPALYRGAKAYVLSTAEETFGRSVTEAMACGCPCVLQALPVLREVAGDAAAWVEFADTAAAGKTLEEICRNESYANRLRSAGLERAREFSFARLARERIEAILSAVQSRP